MPPFNKSAVDGFACRMTDIQTSLQIIETIPAGTPPEKTILNGQCSRIMTGAMLPEGANCVIMVEETEELACGLIKFNSNKTAINICFKGEDIKKGDLVLNKGALIKPPHIAVLATVGAVNPRVSERVKTAILSTGDELVEPEFLPSLSKIRNSNAWQLMAQVSSAGTI